MNGKLFCIMGRSGSGKNTVLERLTSCLPDIPVLLPYTTRPKRSGEENGKDYNFVSEEEMRALIDSGSVVELRAYNTVEGVWYYFTSLPSIDTDMLYITTPEAFVKLKAAFGEDKVIPIYLNVSRETIVERAKQRESGESSPKINEMKRRIAADDIDFSSEKLREAGINKAFENDDLTRVTGEIAEYISSFCSK